MNAILSFVFRYPCVPGRLANFVTWLLYALFLPINYYVLKREKTVEAFVAIACMTMILPAALICTFLKIHSFEQDNKFIKEWMYPLDFKLNFCCN